MKPRIILKITVDFIMTVILFLLMAFELVGRTAHEWLGIGMFLLVLAHHILNQHWGRNVLMGKYTKRRSAETILIFLILLTMLGSMVSGIMLSDEVFAFLNIRSGRNIARVIHMLSAYWGYILLSVHIGFHWSMFLSMLKRTVGNLRQPWEKAVSFFGLVIVIFGSYALIRRDFLQYMFLRTHFVYFDFEEPLIYFFVDYIAIMGLFIFVGNYASKKLKGRMHI